MNRRLKAGLIASTTLLALGATLAAGAAVAGEPLQQPPLQRPPYEKSVFPACSKVKLIPDSLFEQDPKGWLEAIQSCPDEQLQALPSAGFFSIGVRSRPDESVAGGISAQAFLEDVVSQIQWQLDLTKDSLLIDLHCLTQARSAKWLSANWPAIRDKFGIAGGVDAYCQRRRNYYDNEVRGEWAGARGQLAAYWSYDFDRERCRPADPGALKLPSWKRAIGLQRVPAGEFSGGEADAALRACQADTRTIEMSWKGKAAELRKSFRDHPDIRRADVFGRELPSAQGAEEGKVEAHLRASYFTSEMRKLQQRHLAEYDLSVAKFPLIAYLSGAAGGGKGDQAMANGIQRLLSNVDTESRRIGAIYAADRAIYPPNDPNLLDLISYYPAVNEVLQGNPRYCATADSIVNYLAEDAKRKGQIETALMMASGPLSLVNPVLGLAVFASPLLMDLARERRDLGVREVNRFMTVRGDNAFFNLRDEDLPAEERQQAIDLLMVPAIIGAGLVPGELAAKTLIAAQGATAIHQLTERLSHE